MMKERQNIPKGQSRLDNPEARATLAEEKMTTTKTQDIKLK